MGRALSLSACFICLMMSLTSASVTARLAVKTVFSRAPSAWYLRMIGLWMLSDTMLYVVRYAYHRRCTVEFKACSHNIHYQGHYLASKHAHKLSHAVHGCTT